MKPLDLNNLPLDPALEAGKHSKKTVNEVETEEDGKRAGEQRLLNMRHQSKAFMAQTKASRQAKKKAMQEEVEAVSRMSAVLLERLRSVKD